ncbi:hypothetical protein [Polyangium sp. y55x31]|uniref:hypothetical protein n=1 Tax=Polyangium sp. y55x31 TaxID=3042688 RepID=UPI00248311AE|nr:hypothetical protein [Polyangium sp. y55x31]MDI1477950.1 hypothetical protein [Polyangium sp. y55x31]
MDTFNHPTPSWEVGRNSIRLERPDLVHVILRGPNKRPDIQEIQRIMFTIGDRYGSFDFLLGLAELESLGPGARGTWTRVDRAYPVRNAFAYGASFGMQMLVLTTHRAGRLMSPAYFQWDVGFFPTEAAACAQIEAQRRAAEGSPVPA